jgi:hypothetical protein
VGAREPLRVTTSMRVPLVIRPPKGTGTGRARTVPPVSKTL